MRFLADESCDFAVVRALRGAGHDVTAITKFMPAARDDAVLHVAHSEARILLTEDEDFGMLTYAGVVGDIGERLKGAFVVVEPGRARFSKPPGAS